MQNAKEEMVTFEKRVFLSFRGPLINVVKVENYMILSPNELENTWVRRVASGETVQDR